MENEKKIEEKVSKKNKFKVPIIIVSVILVAVIGVIIYLYFSNGCAKDIYFDAIDNVKDALVENTVDSKVYEIKGNMDIEMSSNNTADDSQSLINIINNLDITYGMEFDVKNQKENIDLGLLYKDSKVADVSLNVLNDSIFVNLGSLYDKSIKVDSEELGQVWQSANYDDTKTLINELSEVLKNNLKDEYFTQNKETIKINNKDVKTNKYVLNIEGKEIYEFENGVIEDIKKNDKLVKILANMLYISSDEVIDELDAIQSDLEKDEDAVIRIETYSKKFTKEVVKVTIIDENNEKVEFVNIDKDVYEVTYTNDIATNVLGNMTITDDKFEFNFNYEGFEIKGSTSDKEINIECSYDGVIIKVQSTTERKKSNFAVEFNIKDEDISAKMKIDGTMEEIDKVSDRDNSNYINIENITEDEYLKIYENIYNNDTLLSLIEDISNLNL